MVRAYPAAVRGRERVRYPVVTRAGEDRSVRPRVVILLVGLVLLGILTTGWALAAVWRSESAGSPRLPAPVTTALGDARP